MIDHDIRSAGGKALVVSHIFAGTAQVHVLGIGHWFVGVGDVLLEAFCYFRQAEAQAAIGLEVEPLGTGIFRRPSLEVTPLVAASHENCGFGYICLAFTFQVVIKEFSLKLLVVFGGIEAPMHISEALAIASGPLAVVPGAHHQAVCGSGWILLFDSFEYQQRPEAIFGIEPAADRQYGRAYPFQVRAWVACLPEFIVVGMSHQLIPKLDGVAHITLEVFDWPYLQEELVAVLYGPFEARSALGGRRWPGLPKAIVE